MKNSKTKIELTFKESLLGTVPKNKDVYAKYIMTKAAVQDEAVKAELETVANIEATGWTGFHTQDDKPFIFDYQIKGFFKDACSSLRRVPGTKSKLEKAYKKVIDGLIFIDPRKLFIDLNGELEIIERPLRASTPQGDRVALARSDAAPAGSKLTFELDLLDEKLMPLVEEWFDYGSRRGLGQWRNSGQGAFDWKIV
ncbi:MAG: hypothetical protein WDZ51_06185 [Pirellulaceae bacterium]